MFKEGAQKILWTVIVAVILGSGTFMLNSRDATTKLNAQFDSTSQKVEVLEMSVVAINTTLQELRISNASTIEGIKHLRVISSELKDVTGSLRDTVIRLEERIPSKD